MPATKPKIDEREVRTLHRSLETRAAAEDGLPTAAGYAVLFNAETNIGDYFREKIAPGAFSQSLNSRDVIAVHSHDTGRVVGRTGAGTLTLREDDTGLSFENPLPDTTDGRDLAVQIARGDIPGMSFCFRSKREEWDETVTPPLRTILEADIYEITYSAMPAYPDTSVGLRSLEHARQEQRGTSPGSAEICNAARRARLAQIERGIH
ncbi:MAG TPA: HK97 family phage prohead protease [Sphingobium sp.]|uniref:HK97 family phage prohead protease n=1 Tax=Sphingobium sp. TaxID=1912891 RepID=UPI002ED38BED